MHLKSAALSDTGQKRSANQDNWLIDDSRQAYIVCDGMGGHNAGDVAASEAARCALDYLRQHDSEIRAAVARPGGHTRVMQMVTEAVRSACHSVYHQGQRKPELAGMGSTLTMLLVVGQKAVLAHVGDSRLYLLRSDVLHQLTNDHTLANELVQTGRVAAGGPEAHRFQHVLTRCIGHGESVDVETLLLDLMPGDRFLLCSDGLSNYFAADVEVMEILQNNDPVQACEQFVDFANSRGGTDNITAMVLQVVAESSVEVRQTAEKLDALESTFLCRDLSMHRRLRLANLGEIQQFRAQEWIIDREQLKAGMYVVVAGKCRAVRPSGTSTDLSAGDSFGETGLMRGDRFHIRVQALTETRVLFIPRDQFRDLVARIPKLGRRLLENLLDHVCLQYEKLLSEGADLTEYGVWVRVDRQEAAY